MRRVMYCLPAAMMLCGSVTTAAPLVIGFTDLNLAYDGTNLTDAGDPNGGNADPNQADPLSNVEFNFNGNLVGTVSTGAWADILIPDVTGIDPNDPATVITVDPNSGSYFDLLLDAPVTQYLKLEIDEITITYVDAGGVIQFLFGGGVADVEGQELPFNLELVDDVAVSFSTRIDDGSLSDDGTFINGFTSSGTGEVTGNAQIPEPASVLLGCFALFAGVVLERLSAE